MEQILNLQSIGRGDYHFEETTKTLRTNLQFCDGSLKTIMFTSLLSGEGKSETALSVRVSFGSVGRKVLLIDADARRPVPIKRYKIKGSPSGLSQHLSGQRTMEDICYTTDIENFYMILTGPYSLDPAELLEDQLFKELLERAKERHGYIIVDTPPMANPIGGAVIAG